VSSLAARYRRRDTAEDLPDRGTRLAEDATETVTAGRNAGRATAETITRRDGATELPINDYNTLTARTGGARADTPPTPPGSPAR